MPTYEYECKKCGNRFERFQSISEPRVKRCPDCSGAVKRLIGTGAGIIFKGSGFYCTDYRSPTYKEAASKEKSSAEPKSEKKESATVAPKESAGSKASSKSKE